MAPPDTLEVTTTYLEMDHWPRKPRHPAPGQHSLALLRAEKPPLHFYRYLYDAIGRDWTWVARRLLSDRELDRILADPAVEVNVLWVAGVPAGYAELDRRQALEVELAYFGLLPEFIGRGLGRWLLDWTVHHAWRQHFDNVRHSPSGPILASSH